MAHAWYFVVLIDFTYNTNFYKKVAVQLIGVMPVKKQVRVVLGSWVPNAFVMDKERGLGVALIELFPFLHHFLYVWHMKRNIEVKVTKFLGCRDKAEPFILGPSGEC